MADQHLYLMQNEHGLIKIGRSCDPERRRLALEVEERCRLAIVAIQRGWGDFEEEIHIELADSRLIGEWFDGDPVTREHALIAFGMPEDTAWPFALNDEAADAWLDMIGDRRSDRALRRIINRALQSLRERPAGAPFLDAEVWRAIMWSRGSDALDPDPMPRITTDLDAAMLMWREGKRPARWDLSAVACCAAILRDEWKIIQRRYRKR